MWDASCPPQYYIDAGPRYTSSALVDGSAVFVARLVVSSSASLRFARNGASLVCLGAR